MESHLVRISRRSCRSLSCCPLNHPSVLPLVITLLKSLQCWPDPQMARTAARAASMGLGAWGTSQDEKGESLSLLDEEGASLSSTLLVAACTTHPEQRLIICASTQPYACSHRRQCHGMSTLSGAPPSSSCCLRHYLWWNVQPWKDERVSHWHNNIAASPSLWLQPNREGTWLLSPMICHCGSGAEGGERL